MNGKHIRTQPAAYDKQTTHQTTLRIVRGIALLLAAACACFVALEAASNLECYLIPPANIAFCVAVIALFLATLYFLGQRHVIFPLIGAIAITILGIVEYFVIQFKGAPILPGDILAAGTALNVAGEYEFIMPISGWVSIGCGVLACVLLILAALKQGSAKGGKAHAISTAIGAGAAVLMIGLLLFSVKTNFLGIGINYFSAQKNYVAQGFIPTFARAANDMRMVPPEGYSDEAAIQLEKDAAAAYDASVTNDKNQQAANKQFEQLQPSIVVIMNESYSDLSLFEELHDGYKGTYLTTQNIDGALQQGWLTVPVIGGGTADVEFEMLTGVGMGLLGPGKHPYPQFNFETASNLARFYAQQGYHTSAMHAAAGSNYRRESVYPQMGFHDSYFIEDFPGASRWHGWIDDGPTYDKILEILEDESQPHFVFDVTVQNHGGYDKGNLPTSKPGGYTADWLEEEDNAKMNDFVACIERSDEYLQTFLKQLKQLDRPVAVLFFGDHQPRMAEYFNNDLFEDENELEHFARITKVPYLIWANYDVDGRIQDGTIRSSTCSMYLGPVLMQAIGSPMSDYHKALLQASNDIEAISSSSFRDKEGALHTYDEDTPEQELLDQIAIMQFYEFP